MAESICVECTSEMESEQPAVRCEEWWHHECASLKTTSNNKVLTHHQIIFLCLMCLDLTQKEWKKKKEKKEKKDEGTQKEKKKYKCEERNVHTDREKLPPSVAPCVPVDRQPPAGPPQIRTMKRKALIQIIGNSMVQKTLKYVKCAKEGSGCISMSGIRIKDVARRVEAEVTEMKEEGMLIIQGRVNNLVQNDC